MHPCVVMVDDVVPVVECPTVHKCVNAVVGQGIVDVWSSGVDEYVLGPIPKSHRQEGHKD